MEISVFLVWGCGCNPLNILWNTRLIFFSIIYARAFLFSLLAEALLCCWSWGKGIRREGCWPNFQRIQNQWKLARGDEISPLLAGLFWLGVLRWSGPCCLLIRLCCVVRYLSTLWMSELLGNRSNLLGLCGETWWAPGTEPVSAAHGNELQPCTCPPLQHTFAMISTCRTHKLCRDYFKITIKQNPCSFSFTGWKKCSDLPGLKGRRYSKNK